jgi:hypothetical protein
LDSLIKIFRKKPNLKLIICGLFQEEISKLPEFSENIINMGYVRLNSDEFLQLCYNTSFVILPSIAEGVASGVLTCMNHGLIPLISKECGIRVENDYLFSDLSEKNIEKKIDFFSNLTDLEIEKHRKAILNYTRANYNMICFRNSILTSLK